MQGKTILLISPESWDGIFVSKHHYATELAKRGNMVYFLNPPSPGLKKIILTNVGTRLFSVDYAFPMRGLRLLPAFIRHFIERRFLRKLGTIADVCFDVVWNFENSRFFDFHFAPKDVLTIYHQVDLNQNFNPKVAATTADIVFAVNTPIAQSLSQYNKKVFIIPHGYHSNESSNMTAFEKWKTAFNAARVKAVYVGNLDSFYLDVPLFEHILQQHTDINFFLLGPYKKDNTLFKKFQHTPHVHFTGRLPFDQIQPFLNNADVLLMLYRADEFKDFLATSHKALEYLASGKIIVSSFMEDYVPHKHLLAMSKHNSELPALFQAVLKNLSVYNDEGKLQERKTFALDNTYVKQLDRITQYLEQTHLLP